MIVVIIKAMVKAIVEKVIKRLWNRFFRRSYPPNQYPPGPYQAKPKPPPSYSVREDSNESAEMPATPGVDPTTDIASTKPLPKVTKGSDMMNNETYTCTAEEREFLDLMHDSYLEEIKVDRETASFTFARFVTGQSGHRLVEVLYAALNSNNNS